MSNEDISFPLSDGAPSAIDAAVVCSSATPDEREKYESHYTYMHTSDLTLPALSCSSDSPLLYAHMFCTSYPLSLYSVYSYTE